MPQSTGRLTLSLCLPFYRNGDMLAEQYRIWAAYPDDLKQDVEIVLVDDGSPSPAADVLRPDGLPTLRIYRVLTDIPWHQHGARNLAAHEAEGVWLLLTDMDHVLPAASLRELLSILPSARPSDVFTFYRLDAPDLKPTVNEHGRLKPHVNTFAIRKELYWRIGGYDEDLIGYGTDGFFRKRLYAVAHARHLAGIPIIRYSREVIADASGSRPGMDPRAFRDKGRRGDHNRRVRVRKAKTHEGPAVLTFPWERIV